MKGGAIKLKIVAKTMEKAIYKWRPARLLRFAELGCCPVDWVEFAFKGEKPGGVPRRLGIFSIGSFFSCLFFFYGYNSDSFIRLSVRKEVESDPREEN